MLSLVRTPRLALVEHFGYRHDIIKQSYAGSNGAPEGTTSTPNKIFRQKLVRPQTPQSQATT